MTSLFVASCLSDSCGVLGVNEAGCVWVSLFSDAQQLLPYTLVYLRDESKGQSNRIAFWELCHRLGLQWRGRLC